MAQRLERYASAENLPQSAPVFPLSRTILLPGRELPLNIFEPRYLAMVDACLAGDRVIGMVQPESGGDRQKPGLRAVGGLGRITAYSERSDGKYMICLTGISRFRLAGEHDVDTAYRQCRLDFDPFPDDLKCEPEFTLIDRTRLLAVFAAYLSAHEMEADWEEIARSDNETLVNTLAMIGPFGTEQKQSLLEADGLATRAEVLIALTELILAQNTEGPGLGTRTH